MWQERQANESLNGAMSKKCPKSICYSTSESADFRFALTVGEKNKGRGFVQNVISKLGMKSSKHLSQYVEYANTCISNKRKKAQTAEFKHRRNNLEKLRTLLKSRKETTEGNTYETNLSFLDVNASKIYDNIGTTSECIVQRTLTSAQYTIIFFDLETSGLHLHCDILQIAMKCDVTNFNMYIHPNTPIPKRASNVNGLSWIRGELYLHGLKVQSYPLSFVLEEMLNILKSLEKKCILVAHNCNFDAPRLICSIKKSSLLQDFSDVIAGFCDTLPLIRTKFPEKRKKGQCTLKTLAEELLLPTEGAHDAGHDVYLLEQISLRYLNSNDIVNNYENYYDVVNKVENKINATKVEVTYNVVKDVFSKAIIKRLAISGISYDIVSTFKDKGEECTISLLQGKVNGRATLVKTIKDLDTVLRHVKSL